MPQFDDFEIKMLDVLQRDGRKPVSELAQEIGLSTTPCARRFEALQDAGIIKGFAAVISRRAVGLMVEVFIQVRLVSHSDGSPESFIAAVQRMDEVSSCWTMTGDHDFLLHVMVPSVDELNAFVMHRLMRLDGVRDVHTQLVLQNIKGPGHVPLAHLRTVDAHSAFLRKSCTQTAETGQSRRPHRRPAYADHLSRRSAMKIVLINPPHTAIGSRVPDDHLPPLGLLAIGGPLIDAGHDVRLVDAEFGPMPLENVVRDALDDCPGLRPDRPFRLDLGASDRLADRRHDQAARAGDHDHLWRRLPDLSLARHPGGEPMSSTSSCAAKARRPSWRWSRRWKCTSRWRAWPASPFATICAGPSPRRPAMTIADLDAYRVGWELIDHSRYSYWGGKRAVVMQFSRGCPHLCNYCGQRGFWTRWRHRDPRNSRRRSPGCTANTASN